MPFKINMSAGELFDLVRPVAIFIAALLSTWVLASARKRFPLYAAIAWTAGTLFLPLIVLPVYLSVILICRRPVYSRRWRFVVPLAYGLIVISALSAYFYFDNQSVDAYLARATEARLDDDTATAIREYKRALDLEENAHTRKLLAIELAQAGYLTEAISEFRLAQQGGEPDDLIYYNLGLLLERLEQKGQARLEFQNFLLTNTCTQVDQRCAGARERIRRLSE